MEKTPGGTKELERWWSDLNAKVIISVRYPTLWLTPFLDLPLTARGISSAFAIDERLSWGMAVLVELLGVSCGDNAMEAWVTKASKQQRWTTIGLYGVYFAATTFFIVAASDWRAVTFPLLGVVGVLGAAAQAWRQVAKDERAATRAEAKAAKDAERAAKLAEEAAKADQQAAWADQSLPRIDRVRAWLSANSGQSLRQGARDTGIPWSSFDPLAKQVLGIGQEAAGEEQG